jgi:phage virion morphogenesis protein
MSSIAFDVDFNETAVRTRLEALLARLSEPERVWGAIGEHLVNSTKERLGGGVAPDGSAWAPLAASTIRQRTKKGHVPITILKAGGKLAGSVGLQIEGDSLRVGAGAGGGVAWDYAAIHQLGGTIEKSARVGNAFGRENVSVGAYSISIPARPYLGISAEDEVVILELMQDWLDTE